MCDCLVSLADRVAILQEPPRFPDYWIVYYAQPILGIKPLVLSQDSSNYHSKDTGRQSLCIIIGRVEHNLEVVPTVL